MYWEKYSKSIQAVYVESKYWDSPKVVYDYQNYQIIFDHYTIHRTVGHHSFESTVTRIYCQMHCDKPIELRIHKLTFFTRIRSFFRKNQLKIGDERFNRKYRVYLNSEMAPTFLKQSIVNKIIQLDIGELSMDKYDGIWGNVLPKGTYQLATYIDENRVEFCVLDEIKKLFEDLINSLEISNRIKPIGTVTDTD